jgi:hypothetical protein
VPAEDVSLPFFSQLADTSEPVWPFVSPDNALEVHHGSTGLSSQVIVSRLQSGRCGATSDLSCLLVTGGDNVPKLVMKGSPVRVRASALKDLQNAHFCFLARRRIMCSNAAALR